VRARVATLEAEAKELRAQQLAAAAEAAHATAALEADKAAAVEKLDAELKRVECERQRETASLKSKVHKMQSMQSAALAAGSARSRQMLYAETLKQRRNHQSGLPQQALHTISVDAPATPPPPVKWPGRGKAPAAADADADADADNAGGLSPEPLATGA